MLNMVSYEEGGRVKIVAGLYKKNGYGVFLGPCGKTRWKIRVDGDSQAHRNLWKSSIAPVVVDVEAEQEEDDVCLSRDEYDSLLKEMATLTKAMKALEIKLKKMEK